MDINNTEKLLATALNKVSFTKEEEIRQDLMTKKAKAMLLSGKIKPAQPIFRMPEDPEMNKLMDLSLYNRSILSETKTCGCYYCCRIFSPSEIVEWCKKTKTDTNRTTALCPYCGIDSIIPEYAGKVPELTYSLLKKLKQYAF